MGFEDPLYRFGMTANTLFSDMNGWGHYGRVAALYSLYWGFFCVLLFLATHVLWNRGILDTLGNQFRQARHAITPAAVVIFTVALAGFIGMGGYLFYNTRVLNEYVTREDLERRQVEYEERYLQLENVPQPRIVDVYVEVDIYPHQRRYDARGHYIIENRTEALVGELVGPHVEDVIYVGGFLDPGDEADAL